MPRDGTGNYTRSDGTRTGTTVWDKNKTAGIKITSTAHDLHDQDMADAINDSVAKDGQTEMTGDLDMGGNNLTNVGTVAATSYTPELAVLGVSFTYVTQTAEYNIFNNVCTFWLDIEISGWTGSASGGVLSVTGLPANATTVTAKKALTVGQFEGFLTIDDSEVTSWLDNFGNVKFKYNGAVMDAFDLGSSGTRIITVSGSYPTT